ncbi:MAG: hypothetical protein OEQ29_01750 [Alphaproteobacteria bacterium]|nr:hypothetical protein [Alphaproteobacteria bacterium]
MSTKKGDGADNGVGHNHKLTNAESEALFFHHLKPILAQKAVVAKQQTELNRLRKLCKADGFKLKLVDAAVEMDSAEDESIVVEDLRDRLRVASWLGLPVGHQLDLLDNPDRSPLVDTAYAAGLAAGKLAKARTSPHADSTDAGQAWLRGYDEAQDQAKEDLKTAMDKLNARMKKPKENPIGDHDVKTGEAAGGIPDPVSKNGKSGKPKSGGAQASA